MKGIILAGGSGSRLSPLTDVMSKHLLPIYDKPMIFYPISTLEKAGIREILVISTGDHIRMYEKLLKGGKFPTIEFSFCVQDNPNGLPEAFILGKEFIGDDDVILILGDNLFLGDEVSRRISEITSVQGGVIFGKTVIDPERFGIAILNEEGDLVRIEEKPKNPSSNVAVVGLYMYDSSVIDKAEGLKPSERGETEITDLNNSYLREGKLKLITLGESTRWLDTGTFDSLLEAGVLVSEIERGTRSENSSNKVHRGSNDS